MRIDPNSPANSSTQTSQVNEQRTSTPSYPTGASQAELNDTVQLSSDQATLRQLSTQLNQVPDVRTQQVEALRLQIQLGTFSRSSEAVAGAMVNEFFGAVAEG